MDGPSGISDQEFGRFRDLIYQIAGIQLSDAKKVLLVGRLSRRLKHYGLSTFAQYYQLVTSPQESRELQTMVDLLTTNETYFFREFPHFEFLGQWLGRRKGPLRLWSAACSSGEEPYSLAMTVAEHATGSDWSILASDLSQSMLTLAEQGIYDIAQARYFPDGWMQRHCLCGVGDMHGRLRVQAHLRARVSLREINLVQPLPEGLGPFDVIFLRNILIYFDTPQKQLIVQRLVNQLRPGGLLFIGHAESIHGFELPLRLVHPSVFERV